MQTIILLKDVDNLKKGDIKEIKYNDAHRLIQGGFARIYKYPNKMMLPTKKGYRVKKWL